MVRSYKIHKSYHTSHHNTTKIHPQNSTLLNFQASSNAPTLTTLPPNHKQSQPFLPAIQRSADGSSNSRQTTLPTTLKDQPGRCVRSVTGSAGGELILGCPPTKPGANQHPSPWRPSSVNPHFGLQPTPYKKEHPLLPIPRPQGTLSQLPSIKYKNIIRYSS